MESSRATSTRRSVRVEYTLTPLGWQLTEPLMALYEWAIAHESELAGSVYGLQAPSRLLPINPDAGP